MNGLSRDRVLKAGLARIYVMQRGMCFLCGEYMDPFCMTKDHFVPKSLGGKDNHGNYVLVHPACNGDRGNRLPTEKEIARYVEQRGVRPHMKSLRKAQRLASSISDRASVSKTEG